ncbi:MAG: winged helix DNA-binding domain-containing protein [Anaerolineae bacterium]
MIAVDIAHHRLHNQRIAQEKFGQPSQVVTWFGAMQAQDYASIKWAVGLRCYSATDVIIEQAIVNKTIVRTWLTRGTLQVVAASDVRWMLALLAPRIIANSNRRYQQLKLDNATLARSYEILTEILQDGKQMSRAKLMLILEGASISTTGQRGYHILRRAGLEGLICFGPIQDKQETFVLLDEWVPHGKNMTRDEALGELAGRYFESHGPATLQDFIWWSGLRAADARTGLEMVKSRFDQVTIERQTYWLPQNNPILKDSSPTVYLLPAFDEYFLGYKARDAVLDVKYDKQAVSSNGVFRPMVVIDGQIVGIWKRANKKGSVIITPSPFNSLTKAENQALLGAANQYGAFLGLSVMLA